MALETCHDSVAQDIDVANQSHPKPGKMEQIA